VEELEGRWLPSTYYAASATDLIADINAANKAGGTNTIVLSAPTTSPYILTKVDNVTDGATGLPVVGGGSTADNLTIVGNGDTIGRSTASGTPAFRLLDVAGGSSLTIQNLTLEGGLAYGSGTWAEGGAIYNQGALTLSGVTVQNNTAKGASGSFFRSGSTYGQPAEGGGIFSSGALTLQNGTLVHGNSAVGGMGASTLGKGGPKNPVPGFGGGGFGGGLFIAGGTANLTNATISNDTAQGGQAGVVPTPGGFYQVGHAGPGKGGGLYVGAGTVSLASVTVQDDSAYAPVVGFGDALGGGLCVGGGTVNLANVTLAYNTAYGLEGYGGGLAAFGGAVRLDTVIVQNNTAEGCYPGEGFGGGLCVLDNITVSLCAVTVQYNTASGGAVQDPAQGGGLYISTISIVYLDTQTTVANNTANIDPDIAGSYTLQNCP
jgi:hypothetical protein